MLTTTVALLAGAALLGGATTRPLALDLGQPALPAENVELEDAEPVPGVLAVAGTTSVVVLAAAVASGAILFYGLTEETFAGNLGPWTFGALVAGLSIAATAPVLGAVAGDARSGMTSSWLWVEVAGCVPSGLVAAAVVGVSSARLAEGRGMGEALCLVCVTTPILTVAGTSLGWWLTAEPTTSQPPVERTAMAF